MTRLLRPLAVLILLALAAPAAAQERAYFVTYDHYLEEPGNLEVAVSATTGFPRHPHSAYLAPWLELEYGFTGWWTSELYMEGVTTTHDGSGYTGWRWENRFRPLTSEHAINPVLYVEYENTSEASRIQKEIVGSEALPFEPIAALRRERAHELEGKLILSSALGAWNLSENAIFEKNLSDAEGIEFGYAIGIARSLGGLARGTSCRLCRENFVLGVEAYGGLGSSVERDLDDTRHFVAPVLGWHLGPNSTLKASFGFGLTDQSDRYLLRVGYAHELPLRSAKP